MPKKRKPKSELDKWREGTRRHQLTKYYAMKQQKRNIDRTLQKKYYSGSVDATLRRLKRRR
tara:strand:+ start:318 stop:500 length:183 start_codon:yes stop_codon:yes gene_type:complete